MARAQTSSRPAGEHAKRLSLSEIVELLLTRSGGETSSVTLSRNAKGETQIEVKVRTGDTDEVRTAADAANRARTIYDELRSAYPMASGHTGAQGS